MYLPHVHLWVCVVLMGAALACSTNPTHAGQLLPAENAAPTRAVEAEPGVVATPIPILGLELGLPEPPAFVVAEIPALATDGTWSIRGLRKHLEALLPEADPGGRVVLVSAYVQEVYATPVCPKDELCPPGKVPHAWLVDDSAVRGKADALMLVGIHFPIPAWDQQTQLEWADAPVPVLEVGERYVFMGWFRRFTDMGFAHDQGLLELVAITTYPADERSVWIAPPNSTHHPRVRQAQGLAPLPERASIPEGVVPGAPLDPPTPLVEPRTRQQAQTLAREARHSSQPLRADYYHRWLIVDDPGVTWAWVELANMYVEFGERPAGIAILDIALARAPNDAKLHIGRGRLFLNLGQPAVAVGSYERALELDPDAPDALFGLGMAYAETRNDKLAIAALERFLVVAGDAPSHVIRAAEDTIARLQF